MPFFECIKDVEYPAFSLKEGIIRKKFKKGEVYEMHVSTRTADEFREVDEDELEDEQEIGDEDGECDDETCPDCGEVHPKNAGEVLEWLEKVLGKSEEGNEEDEGTVTMSGMTPTIVQPKPKYRVGDYVVAEGPNPNEYIKISCLQFDGGKYKYNQDVGGYYEENALRKPNKAELAMYFR